MDTPTRLLRLLGLLTARAGWSAEDLANETDVTVRTVRRDVARLRELGYPVDGTPGPSGGYVLGRSGRLPPLLLDDDEAVATAIALRYVAGGDVLGGSSALSAFTKLDQVLPARLRERVAALATVTTSVRPGGLPPVDVDILVTAALACRRSEKLRFTYRDAEDRMTDRLVEPYRLVYTDRNWYVVAFDRMRDGWRIFRIDRTADVRLTGLRFEPVAEPPDAASMVARGLAIGGYDHHATVRVDLPLDQARPHFPPTIAVLEDDGAGGTLARIGGDPDWIARYLAGLTCQFEVVESDEVRAELRALGRRLVKDHPRRSEHRRHGAAPTVRP